MLKGESHQLHCIRRKDQVLWLLNQAANLEPAGQLHPCKKNSDTELVSCSEGEEADTHPLSSNMVLIWKQIGDGNSVSIAKLSLPGADLEMFRSALT